MPPAATRAVAVSVGNGEHVSAQTSHTAHAVGGVAHLASTASRGSRATLRMHRVELGAADRAVLVRVDLLEPMFTAVLTPLGAALASLGPALAAYGLRFGLSNEPVAVRVDTGEMLGDLRLHGGAGVGLRGGRNRRCDLRDRRGDSDQGGAAAAPISNFFMGWSLRLNFAAALDQASCIRLECAAAEWHRLE